MSTVPEVLERADISYRQLEHWCSRGYVPGAHRSPGSGNSRVFAPDDVAVIVRMGVLTRLGFKPSVAASVAREMLETSTVRLGNLTLTMSEETE